MTAAEFQEVRAFLAVADERSFRRAATRLSLSPSALSRTIRALEARVGVRLLNRTTRSVSPTEAGQALYAQVRPLVVQMDTAVREVGTFQVQPKGTVRLNLSRVAATMAILPRLGAFMAAYPDVRLDLVIDDDLTDVVARGFDAGIRIGGQVDRDMVAVRVTPDFRMAVVGAPAYFEGRSVPQRPEDLSRHRCLTYRWQGSGALFAWTFLGPGGPLTVDVESVLTGNDTDLLRAAAVRGVGLAFLAETVVAPLIAGGDLVRVLEDWCAPVSGFYLYYASRSHMPAALRAFVDFMKSVKAAGILPRVDLIAVR